MNIFEGSRRVAWAVVWLSLVVALILIFTYKPYVTLHYVIPDYGMPAKYVEQCRSAPEDARHYFDMVSASGRPYSVQLCFTATESLEGGKLVSYMQSGDDILMNTNYSDSVKNYMQQVANKYISTNPDATKAESLLDAKKSENHREVLLWLAVFLFCFFLLVTGVGWIVRGFAGIPRGSDRRPEPR